MPPGRVRVGGRSGRTVRAGRGEGAFPAHAAGGWPRGMAARMGWMGVGGGRTGLVRRQVITQILWIRSGIGRTYRSHLSFRSRGTCWSSGKCGTGGTGESNVSGEPCGGIGPGEPNRARGAVRLWRGVWVMRLSDAGGRRGGVGRTGGQRGDAGKDGPLASDRAAGAAGGSAGWDGASP